VWFEVAEVAFWSSGLFLSGALIVLCLCTAVVVFGAGAVDPRLAVRRTVLYSTLAIGGVFAFGVVETAVTDLLIATWGLPPGAGAVIAGGVMAVSFRPVHRAVERLLSKIFGEAGAA
jgi:hypothetical protein